MEHIVLVGKRTASIEFELIDAGFDRDELTSLKKSLDKGSWWSDMHVVGLECKLGALTELLDTLNKCGKNAELHYLKGA